MRVLGVDPGTSVTGYGVVDVGDGNGAPPLPGRLVECGTITLASRAPLARRLQQLHEGIADLILRHRPTTLALEDAFLQKNVRTTLVLGHARGVVLLAAQQAGLNIFHYPPATIKKTVAGAGAARKAQVAMMVARLLRLAHPPRPADAADGVAVALTHILRA
ncbi:MAG: crossover junction endodeoxyribonuclease RuvC [Gemmatimonadetes bacterium]|nr:MAG: crossover junction endodeoxyribonuclease RuvC [Gemmatimonadota bacterium]